MFKSLIEKLQLRVWGWPTLFLWFVFCLLGITFWLTNPHPGSYFLEPGSKRELVFENSIGILFVGYLWVLVNRFRQSNIRVSRLARYGVIILTIIFVATVGIDLFIRYHKFEYKQQVHEYKHWVPLPEQIKKAEIAAIKFAREELKMSEEILNRIKYKTYGFYKDDKQIIHLEFLDPQVHPDWENTSALLGGFPGYFTISVNPKNFKIVALLTFVVAIIDASF